MNMHLFILFWIGILAFFARQGNVYVTENVLGKEVKRTQLWFAILMFLPIFLYAFLGPPMVDVNAYLGTFDSLPNSFEELQDSLKVADKEYGFIIFGTLIKMMFGNNHTIYRMFIALIHSIPLVLIFRKYSSDYSISIFLFVASASYAGWMMNGLRQFMAVTIIFAATPLLLKKKYLPLILIILLASSFHRTAIIMILIIFMVNGKAWNLKTMFFLTIAVIATYLFANSIELLDNMLLDTDYSISSMQAEGDDGTNPIRVLVFSVPTIFAFIGRKYIKADNDPVINVCTNMSIITTALYLVSMTTSGILLGRMPIYTSLYSYILLPYIVDRLFNIKSSKLIKLSMIILYLLYYYYQMHILARLI